ncbi:hypothetical protein ABH924_003760 [Arthrobacter sp. GAS37]|uniref:hypothetical protein n=1 Tax=Arthrobacter sp. GAS37 TaxID=3156261 RepID=UPI003836B96E
MPDQHPAPKSRSHHPGCEEAANPECDCRRCFSLLHQHGILSAAITSEGSPTDFKARLTDLFGSAFTKVDSDPVPAQSTRREWQPIATAGTGKRRTQTEQRFVDVTLRDVLWNVHSILHPPSFKAGWLELAEGLTVTADWEGLAARLTAWTGDPDDGSGYFWSSMLAAAAVSPWTAGTPGAPDIITQSSLPQLGHARFPRAGSGRNLTAIREMANTNTTRAAADVISRALSRSALAIRDRRLVLAVVGSAVSPDLWHHPAATRHHLIPAVLGLRTRHNAQFSLDNHDAVEDRIDGDLGQKWRDRAAW